MTKFKTYKFTFTGRKTGEYGKFRKPTFEIELDYVPTLDYIEKVLKIEFDYEYITDLKAIN